MPLVISLMLLRPPALVQPTPRAPLTLIEVEQAADEALQIVCEKWQRTEAERDVLLGAAIALVETLDRTTLIKTWTQDELEQLRAAIIALTEETVP